MLTLSDEAVATFTALYEAKYGKPIDTETAKVLATQTAELVLLTIASNSVATDIKT